MHTCVCVRERETLFICLYVHVCAHNYMMCEFMHVRIVCKYAYLQDIQINKVYTILIPKTKMLNLKRSRD